MTQSTTVLVETGPMVLSVHMVQIPNLPECELKKFGLQKLQLNEIVHRRTMDGVDRDLLIKCH